MIRLADAAQGRDNNLNLIRMIAACLVLVSHAYPIALGPGTVEPLERLLGYSLGTLSVTVFFVISGFLIAQSFERTKSRTGFVVARFLRLWPGLIVSILLVALLLGPWVSTLGVERYFRQSETWLFVLRNVTLIDVQFTLPGVFTYLPYTSVEGSIWTLLYEVVCYVGVFVLGIVGLLRRPGAMVVAFVAFAALFVIQQAGLITLHSKISTAITLAMPFGVGTGLYVWRDRIVLSLWGVAILAALTWGAVLISAWVPHSMAVYPLLLATTLGYAVFWLAYCPGGVLRLYNRLGDYSYGVYIYAFPIQGLVIWIWGDMTPGMNMALALPLTLIPSILSWHWVEKPCLDRRHAVTAWLRRTPRSAQA